MKATIILAGFAASTASAHTIFAQLTAGGTTYPVSHGIRTPSYDGVSVFPLTEINSVGIQPVADLFEASNRCTIQ